ncbi:MAG TPA: LacI family DNA-binding transcriptional regulator, partial [Cytophagaceae bacterium]
MGKPEITIKDIALRLSVSVSTVSRALSNHPRIGLRTKEKVLALAKELNYRPNPIAVNLKKKRTRNIGLIIPDLSKPFYSRLITGA